MFSDLSFEPTTFHFHSVSLSTRVVICTLSGTFEALPTVTAMEKNEGKYVVSAGDCCLLLWLFCVDCSFLHCACNTTSWSPFWPRFMLTSSAIWLQPSSRVLWHLWSTACCRILHVHVCTCIGIAVSACPSLWPNWTFPPVRPYVCAPLHFAGKDDTIVLFL